MVVGLVFLGAIQAAVALDSDPSVVDESPALSIENFDVSRYILDKNYNQFVAAHNAKAGRQPSKDEISEWFRLFVARQAIHARLVANGYLARPEVQRETTRMVRQILTQIDGPLYESLQPPDALAPERLRALHETSARVFDALMVRFDDAATAAGRLGPVASSGDFELAVRTLVRTGKSSMVDISDGPSAWPHGAFQEIADLLPEAPPGTVIGPIPRALGVYFLLVRSESRRPVPDFETSRAQWENHVRRTSRNLVQRVRRRRILQESEFLTETTAIKQFQARMLPVVGQPHTIDGQTALDDPEKILATYTASGERRRITDRDFVRHFNQRIIRSMPRDTAGLISAIEDILVEEYDYAAAIAAHLDREPKFVQDRKNFELKQALALYENEILAPGIGISSAELQSYYAARSERYSVPGEATGTFYKFASNAAATEALLLLRHGATAAAAALAEEVTDSTMVRRDGLQLVADRPNAAIMAMPDGRTFGPFDHLGRPAIFAKHSSGRPQAPPLGEIEGVVRQDFLREKLDALELDLFREQGAGRALRVFFEFSEYGIEDPFGDGCADSAIRPARVSVPSSPTRQSG